MPSVFVKERAPRRPIRLGNHQVRIEIKVPEVLGASKLAAGTTPKRRVHALRAHVMVPSPTHKRARPVSTSLIGELHATQFTPRI